MSLTLVHSNNLIKINYYDPVSGFITRHVCFYIAKTLEEKGLLPEKSEFAQYYFGGFPCNSSSFNDRVKNGRDGFFIQLKPGDENGFNIIHTAR